jgi:carbon storage regulator
MLILSRKNLQSVMIGTPDDLQHVLKVTVLGIRGNNVKLGFEVAANVPIHRLEVWERIYNGHPCPLPEQQLPDKVLAPVLEDEDGNFVLE